MISNFYFEKLSLEGAILIKPFSSTDLRGSLIKDYSEETFFKNGINHVLKEVFYTISKKGVIRALHFQEVNHQAKLVRCISGKVFDVIVDLRPESPTFKKWLGFYLTGDNQLSLLVPAHFAHGYLVLEDSIVSYKCSSPFDGRFDSGIKYDDPDINVQWPINELDGVPMIIAEKDRVMQSFQEYFKKGCK
jgi:dTDP-4-dehydrorhamnose 3,5-epimerase